MSEKSNLVEKQPILFVEAERYRTLMHEINTRVMQIENKVDTLEGLDDKKDPSLRETLPTLEDIRVFSPVPQFTLMNDKFGSTVDRLQNIINTLNEII